MFTFLAVQDFILNVNIRANPIKNLGITIDLTLEEILEQHEKTVSIKHTDGSRHLVNLKIPSSKQWH